MHKPNPIPRILFGLAIGCIGLQHFIYHHFSHDLEPLPAAMQVRWAAHLMGIVLLILAVCMVTGIRMRQASLIFALLYLTNTLLVHVPRVAGDPQNGNEWATCFEALMLSAGGLLMAGAQWRRTLPPYLFAVSLLVFGILHFVYAKYIATLIPSWIPAQLFWAWFFGVAFVAAAIAIAIRKKARLAGRLLAFMFFIWVIVLHIPRVIAHRHAENEWTSLFIAVALGSASWLLEGTLRD